MNEAKKNRIGIIGAGNIVEMAHLPQLNSRIDTQIVWIVDRDFTRAQRLAKSYGAQALQVPDFATIDLALLAVPLGARSPFIEAAAAAKVAIYCEKPAARDQTEHQQLTARFAPHACAIGLQRRFYPQVALLRQANERSWFGQLQSVKLLACNFNLKSGGATHFAQDVAQAGGGITLESAIHLVDIVLWSCFVQSIHVLKRAAFAQGLLDFEMRFSADMQSTKSARLVPFTAEISSLRNDPNNGVELHFERAVLRWNCDAASPVVLVSDTGNVVLGSQLSSITASFAECWSAVFEALRTQVPNASSACHSEATSALMGQLYQGLASSTEQCT